MNYEERIPLFEALLSIATIDEVLSDEEIDYIKNKVVSDEINLPDLDELIEKARRNELNLYDAIYCIKEEDTKIELLRDLFILSHADGHYTEAEKQGIQQVCNLLGINKEIAKKTEEDALIEIRQRLDEHIIDDSKGDAWESFGFLNAFEKMAQAFAENQKKSIEGLLKSYDEASERRAKEVNEMIDAWVFIDGKEEKTLDEILEEEIQIYNKAYDELNERGEQLFGKRKEAVALIKSVEVLVNSIANHPKSFDKEIQEVNSHWTRFVNAAAFAEKELEAAQRSMLTAGGGFAIGASVSSMAPSAAMWTATTFGTASTGTAISTLSGAAARRAALAWLGGGLASAGAGGVAAGEALLALAGPIGWSITGISILSSLVIFADKKNKMAKEKEAEILKIKRNACSLKESTAEIEDLYSRHEAFYNKLLYQLDSDMDLEGADFTAISDEDRTRLGTLVNNTIILANMVSENITVDKKEE